MTLHHAQTTRVALVDGMKAVAARLSERMLRWIGWHAPQPEGGKRLERRKVPQRAGVELSGSEGFVEGTGAWSRVGNILDQIDQCVTVTKKLKRHDREAYDYYKRVGAQIIPDSMFGAFDGLDKSFVKSLPAKGMCFSFAPLNGYEDPLPMLFSFNRIRNRKRFGVEPTQGTVYEVTLYWIDDKPGSNIGCMATYHVSVRDNGATRLLKEDCVRTNIIPYPRGFKYHGRLETKTRFKGYPGPLCVLYNEVKMKNPSSELISKGIDKYACGIFHYAANGFMNYTSSGWLVRATKEGVTVAFSMKDNIAPAFFKNRDASIARDGRRKRVFHYVSGHDRRIGPDKIVKVKEHYRGERRFSWAGADVVVSVPGHHHNNLNTFSVEAMRVEDSEPRLGWMDSATLGREMDRHLSA